MSVAVKICGLTSTEAVDAAVRGGAAMTGFVFFPPSPRSLEPDEAAPLVAAVPDGVLKVGVVVDPADDMLKGILGPVPLDALQLHGAEPPERVAEIKARTGCVVIKAIRVERVADIAAADDYLPVVDYLLFDAKPPRGAAVPGGHGRAFDWRIMGHAPTAKPWLLAGGINQASVEEAVRLTGAPAVDVSSGVEASPGVKDPRMIEAFLETARALYPAQRPHRPEVTA